MDFSIPTPFDLPPIVMEKMTLAEFIAFMQSRVGEGYMPSSTIGQQCHSKPEYLRLFGDVKLEETKNTFLLNIAFYNRYPSFYVGYNDSGAELNNEIFVSIPLKSMSIVIGLKSLEVYVIDYHHPHSSLVHRWTEDKTLAVDRLHFIEQMNYL